MNRLSIRTKLIALFVAIKVVPLVALAWFAWSAGQLLAERVAEATAEMTVDMKKTTAEVGETMTADAITALDATSREAMERLTTDAAAAVAAFLYDRDSDVRQAAALPASEKAYRDFLAARQRWITDHEAWVVSPDGSGWVAAGEKPPQAAIVSSAKDNERDFHYRPPEHRGIRSLKPLFAEMTFVGLDGRERVKVTSAPAMAPELRDVSRRENTYVKAEAYFDELRRLKPGEIYVSEVIGAYVPTHMIGAYTPISAEKKGRAFEPGNSAYAGMENPVGRRFEGIVRWATPVVVDGAVEGRYYVDLVRAIKRALPEMHLHAFSPEEILYGSVRSGLPIRDYLAQTPTFRDQSRARKPSLESIRTGELGLDCRYLNFAPQCVGWMDLTRNGGSGSFAIFWSGLWKLTTAATIPYYTGRYAATPRGFGFVTVGANIDDFHRAATEAKDRIDAMVSEREEQLNKKRQSVFAMIAGQLQALARTLSISTVAMCAIVIGIAVWMASLLTRRVTTLLVGIRRFQEGDLDYRLAVPSRDEMGELAISLNHMADAVAESVRRLDEARRRAEEVSRLKSEFLANVSHELRTPLNGILGFADLLREDVTGEEDREHAQIIFDNGRHLLEVVNTLLDVAKIEAGRLELARVPIDLAAMIAGTAGTHEQVARAKGLDFTVETAGDLPGRIVGDPTRVRQVLHNLLNNAIKFTDHGYVHVTVTAADGCLCFAVADSGPGIPDGAREAIFEKFHQLENFSTRSHSGTGLGLALALHLARLMGGTISVASQPGEGSTFRFELPIIEPEWRGMAS
ncbi:MAG: HAMP domain-containing protein [Magnetospirillum sp.]|nr:HAMP domain-containing protein [Magnetospirillum sp.]